MKRRRKTPPQRIHAVRIAVRPAAYFERRALPAGRKRGEQGVEFFPGHGFQAQPAAEDAEQGPWECMRAEVSGMNGRGLTQGPTRPPGIHRAGGAPEGRDCVQLAGRSSSGFLHAKLQALGHFNG